MSDPASVLPEFGDVLSAARRLPLCDGAAKLHALIARVLQTAEADGDLTSAVDALASAASSALEEDPWVQFDRAVRRFKGRPDALGSTIDTSAAAASSETADGVNATSDDLEEQGPAPVPAPA